MLKKILEHCLSICLVTAVLLSLVFFFQQQKKEGAPQVDPRIAGYLDLKFADLSNPFQRALFEDLLNLYHPGQETQNRKLVSDLLRFQDNQFRENVQRSITKETLTREKLLQLAGMYGKFVLVYALVMVLTYYGVQTLGIWRFVRLKQGPAARSRKADPSGAARFFQQTGLMIVKGLAALVLFSPAYVIAYAFKTEINTDTLFFMVLLAVFTNGLLVTYANKFYTFLTTESRKGYVDTAIVKNLHNSYVFDAPGGIPYKAVFKPIKHFGGHVFDHIYRNARSQYFSTLKEQASFVITSLVIIEMALNIHGYLNYEMLRQMLYKNYDIVMAIMLSIFITVKLTEIATDILVHREARKYSNG
jgi:hypothetical protein